MPVLNHVPNHAIKSVIKITMLFIILALPHLAYAQDEGESKQMRVLFIGNSYTSVNNLPGMVQALAKAAKEKRALEYVAVTPGGWTLQQHLLDPKTQAPTKIAQGNWDFVVIQEQSQLPFMYPKVTLEHGTTLGELIKESKAMPLLYMTWAREHQPEHQETIAKTYTDLAKALSAPIVPVGLAWEAARKEKPALKLYAADKSHPSPAGTYLAACVFYSTIYDKSPVGLAATLTTINGGKSRTLVALSAEDAKYFQTIAWKTVQAQKEKAPEPKKAE